MRSKTSFGPHRARVGEHHDEDPERTCTAGHGERAHVSPVDLRLLPDETLDAEVHFAARDWPHLGHVTAQNRDATVITTYPDHARRDVSPEGVDAP